MTAAIDVVPRDASGAAARVFGLTPAIRLARQWARVAPRPGWTLTIGDDVVLDTPALGWLIGQDATGIVDEAGTPLAAWSNDPAAARAWLAGGPAPFPVHTAGRLEIFNGALKKRELFLAFALGRTPARTVEDRLYFASYKGVTDIVTKYAWPHPALAVVRACVACRISPNAVTIVSILLSIAAIPLLLAGDLASGLACAWGMTFLDTVDGKLARTTVSYTDFGNYFDHIPDLLFPPLWWAATAAGLVATRPDADPARLWACFALILASYVVGRLCEGAFELRNGFGPFLWRRVDARFRLILARRNPNLLILTAAMLIDGPVGGYIVLTGWCVVCAGIQFVALLQSEVARRRGPLRSFLDPAGALA